jgi:hypothetical protein
LHLKKKKEIQNNFSQILTKKKFNLNLINKLSFFEFTTYFYLDIRIFIKKKYSKKYLFFQYF